MVKPRGNRTPEMHRAGPPVGPIQSPTEEEIEQFLEEIEIDEEYADAVKSQRISLEAIDTDE